MICLSVITSRAEAEEGPDWHRASFQLKARECRIVLQRAELAVGHMEEILQGQLYVEEGWHVHFKSRSAQQVVRYLKMLEVNLGMANHNVLRLYGVTPRKLYEAMADNRVYPPGAELFSRMVVRERGQARLTSDVKLL